MMDMRIAVACLNDAPYREDNPDVHAISLRNKVEYCLAHDYSLHMVTHSLVQERKAVWSKLPFLITLLPLHDWIFWADTDCLFMNHDIRLEDLIDDRASLIITRDMNGLSAGNFLIRNSQWGRAFLHKAWERSDCFDHWAQEQLAMDRTIEEDPDSAREVKFVQQNTLCSYHDVEMPEEYRPYRDGDFIVHFPAHYGRLRELMIRFAQPRPQTAPRARRPRRGVTLPVRP